MMRPRREFNDLTMMERLAIDQMAWSVYQPNDGDSLDGNVNSWRSNAVRPIVRNKIFSITGHITARTIIPRFVAYDEESQEQHDAGEIMSDLMEWSILNTNSTYADVSLNATLAALVEPVSIVGTQYRTVYRTVKRGKNNDGTYKTEQIIDEDLSGFIDESIPADQLYVQDFYQPDIQKQPWIIRRRVRPFATLRTIYGQLDNFKYVKPGVHVLFNDANQQFYEAYDLIMRQNECEEVIYWNKSFDVKLIVVNGVLISDADNPNEREDKLYPFVTFGYENLRPNGDCFYWKSLAFKTMPDDKIVNTLYPMIIDGSYLAIMPPMILMGDDTIASDVIVPGAVTTLGSDSQLNPILVQSENLKAGFDALQKVESSITESSIDNPNAANEITPDGTAYQIYKAEANAKILLDPFLQMVGRYVKQMGRLRSGDIQQYLTLPETALIEGSANSDLVYKTFVLPNGKARTKGKRIKFTTDTPTGNITRANLLKESYKVLEEQGGLESKQSLSKVNPVLFRKLKYLVHVTPDVISPLSEELERSMGLELWDRAIQDPTHSFDMQEMNKMLLEMYPMTKRHPEKYLSSQGQSGEGGMPQQPYGLGQPQQPQQPQQPAQPNANQMGVPMKMKR